MQSEKQNILRVVLVHSRTTPSGLTQILKGICSSLDSKELEINLILLSKSSSDNQDQFFIDNGVKVIHINEISSLDKLKSLRSIIQSLSPHVIHTHGFQGILFCSLLKLKVPHVSTVHGNLFISYRDDFNWFLGSVIALMHLLLFRFVSNPVLVSKSLKTMFLVPKRVKVVLNGVDKQVFFPLNRENQLQLRRQLNLMPEKFIFISSGRIIKLKQPLLIINTFSKLVELAPNIELHFLGDGELRPILEERYKQLPNVFFHGKQPNIAQWLNAADCFLSASMSEGFPNAPLEAYSCGLPLILSDIGPHQEIEEKIPHAVRLFSNEMELLEQMKAVIENKHRIEDTSSFSQVEMAQNYLQLYKTCQLVQEKG
jgi:glycosyltransferase involved in cell wall biosynthesis